MIENSDPGSRPRVSMRVAAHPRKLMESNKLNGDELRWNSFLMPGKRRAAMKAATMTDASR